MCFTISVEKNAKEAIQQYVNTNKGVQADIDFHDSYFLVSGFAHPKLAIINQWTNRLTGEIVDTFSIITTDAIP